MSVCPPPRPHYVNALCVSLNAYGHTHTHTYMLILCVVLPPPAPGPTMSMLCVPLLSSSLAVQVMSSLCMEVSPALTRLSRRVLRVLRVLRRLLLAMDLPKDAHTHTHTHTHTDAQTHRRTDAALFHLPLIAECMGRTNRRTSRHALYIHVHAHTRTHVWRFKPKPRRTQGTSMARAITPLLAVRFP